jgi:hypothetical protein
MEVRARFQHADAPEVRYSKPEGTDRPEHARSVVNSADVEFDPSRWRALPVPLTGSFLSFLDFFVVNIALASIRLSAADLPSSSTVSDKLLSAGCLAETPARLRASSSRPLIG